MDVFTSINVIRSSLFPTAKVDPSGDQAILIFSPETNTREMKYRTNFFFSGTFCFYCCTRTICFRIKYFHQSISTSRSYMMWNRWMPSKLIDFFSMFPIGSIFYLTKNQCTLVRSISLSLAYLPWNLSHRRQISQHFYLTIHSLIDFHQHSNRWYVLFHYLFDSFYSW